MRKPRPYKEYEPDSSFILSEPFETYSIRSGQGFDIRDRFSIDNDAIFYENSDARKYVIYLYGLDIEQFKKFEVFLKNKSQLLSVRAQNGIKTIGYRNLYVNYLFACERKLYGVRNIGRKSIQEIHSIFGEVIDYVKECYLQGDTSIIEQTHKELVKSANITLREKLGEVQYSLLQKELSRLIESISVRAQNGILNYKGNFIEDFVHHKSNIRNLKNIGRRSEIEIQSVIEQLQETVNSMSEEELSEDRIFRLKKEELYGQYFDDFAYDYFLKNGHLPMFHITENLLKGLEYGRSLQLLNKHIGLFEDVNLQSLAEIAKEISISRERVRQLCCDCISQLQTIDYKDVEREGVNYSKILVQEDWEYLHDTLKNKMLIDEKELLAIREDEKCTLSICMMLQITFLVCKEFFEIVGLEPIRLLKTRGKTVWQNTYLINRYVTEAFEFAHLHHLVENIEQELVEDEWHTAEELVVDTLNQAFVSFDTSKVVEISDVLSYLLINEFGKFPDENFRFVLEGKKEVASTDIIYNILKSNDHPMSIDEIYSELNTILTRNYKSSSSIKGLVARDPRMCMVGTNNLVGLLEWSHIKIGSIRDLIVQYLSDKDEPQHISKISEYILQYRDSSERSIASTMNTGDQFIHFDGGYYGLKTKIYDKWYYLSESERNFMTRMNDFEDFLIKHNHFPFSTSNDTNEKSLYVWWRSVHNKFQLSDAQKNKIRRIEEKYGMLPTGRKEMNWYDMCAKYRSFVEEKRRKPSEHNMAEWELYYWLVSTTHDFYEGNLDTLQTKYYIEICNLL